MKKGFIIGLIIGFLILVLILFVPALLESFLPPGEPSLGAFLRCPFPINILWMFYFPLIFLPYLVSYVPEPFFQYMVYFLYILLFGLLGLVIGSLIKMGKYFFSLINN